MRRRILVATATAAATALVIATSASAETARFSFMHTVSNGNYSVIVSGAFADGGTAHVRNRRGKLWLRDGTIRLRTRPNEPMVHIDPETCVGEVTETGTYRIVGGTGAYRGISGRGTFKGDYTAVARREDGACVQNEHPAAAQLILTARGPVTLP